MLRHLRSLLKLSTDLAERQIVLKRLIRSVERPLADSPFVLTLSYAETVRYFVDERPREPNVARAALVLRRGRFAINTCWVFLDADNRLVCDSEGIPYGRKMRISTLDRELEEAFDNTDVLIVE